MKCRSQLDFDHTEYLGYPWKVGAYFLKSWADMKCVMCVTRSIFRIKKQEPVDLFRSFWQLRLAIMLAELANCLGYATELPNFFLGLCGLSKLYWTRHLMADLDMDYLYFRPTPWLFYQEMSLTKHWMLSWMHWIWLDIRHGRFSFVTGQVGAYIFSS